MFFLVAFLLCWPRFAVGHQEKTDGNIIILPLAAAIETKTINDAITSDDTTTKKPTSPTVTLPVTVIDKISEKDTASIISMKSKRLCKERIVGVMVGICQGCFYQESIETETFGHKTQKEKEFDIPWTKLNETSVRCCKEMCSFADFKKLCCDGGLFRMIKK